MTEAVSSPKPSRSRVTVCIPRSNSRKANLNSSSDKDMNYKKLIHQISKIKEIKKRKSMHNKTKENMGLAVSSTKIESYLLPKRKDSGFLCSKEKLSPTEQLIKELEKPRLVKSIHGRNKGNYDGYRDLKVIKHFYLDRKLKVYY